MLWYALPGGSDMTLVITALILGLIGMEFAAVFNNAMMPDQVPRSHLGRLSGSAWALGYVGGIVSLVIVLVFSRPIPPAEKPCSDSPHCSGSIHRRIRAIGPPAP